VINGSTGDIDLAASTPGTYTITYSFASGACNNTTTASMTINALPTATIAYAGSPYCATGTATVTQTGQAGGTYTAPAGVTINAATGDLDLAASTPGTYTITYSFTSGACNNPTTANITINALPIATITYAGSPYCATGTATVTQTGQAGGTYTAPAGVTINSASGDIDLATSASGTYTITYSFTSGACSNTTTASITINALPIATIAYAGSPYCATGTATVMQSGQAGGTYTAPGGVTINAATGDIDLAASTPGTYTITYSFSSGTCSNTTTTSITINALPTATIAYAGSPYCATGTANVTQTGQAGGTYTAPAGVTINAATGDIDLAASTPGTYTITYSFTSGACSNSTTASITINALPTATIAYAGSPYCATSTATVTQTGQAGGTYSAAPAGVTINAAAGDIDLAASTPGTYTITYTFTNGICANTTTTSITINALPAATIAYAGSPYCATGTATVTQTGQAGGTYTAPAGVTINAATGDIDLAASTPGTYTITYSFAGGVCNNTTTTSIMINVLPTATIAYAGSPYCATGTATVTQTGQAGGTYAAPAGVTINAATGDIDLAASTAGTYTVTYSFTNGTCANTTTASITIKALPTATVTFAGSPYCTTGTANVTLTGQAGGTYTAPAGVTINAATGDIDLASSTPGTFTVTYSFSNGTCANTTTTSITINALPTATIAFSGSPYCATGTATVTQTGQAGGTYAAPAGVTINAATGDIDLTASTPGTYTITYSFTNGTCNNVTTTSVTIASLPVLLITNPAAVCALSTVDITDAAITAGSAPGLTYTYFQDAAGTIVLLSPNAVSANGTYYIRGTALSGCSNIQPVVVTINPKPNVVISNPAPICAPGTVDLTAAAVTSGSTPALTFTYYQDAAATVVLANANAVAASGTYYINGTTAAGCSDIKPVVVTINTLPVASVSYMASPYCAVGTATVTQTGLAGGIYSAPAPVSINVATGDINLAASTPGTYTITYTFTNGTCSNTATTLITINPTPGVVTNNPAPVCAPLTVNLTLPAVTAGSSPGLTFTYFSNAAGTIPVGNPAAISVSGTYYIEGTNGTGCVTIRPVNVTINPLPIATIAYTGSPYCTSGTAIVSLTGIGGGTFASSPGLSLNAINGDINLATSTEGTYTIVYSFTNGICSNSVFTSVTIKNPALVVNNTAAACFPSTVDLTDPSITTGSQGGLTYNYYQDNAGTIPLVNPAAVGIAGTYFIKGTDFLTGCSSNIQPVDVTINAKPTVSASASATDICKGSPVTLTAISPGNTIDWPGVGSGNVVVATPSDSTTFLAIATAPNGCIDTAYVDVAVKPFTLTLTANPDPVLAGTNTTLNTNANFTYNVLSWSPAIFFTDQTALTQNIVVKDTSKSFIVIAQSIDGCLDTASLFVTVDPNLKDFFIPNAFSPNGDGNNDLLKIYGSSIRELTVRVYNQWGELVFETNDPVSGWDGTWKGRPQAVGIYVYVAKVTFYNNTSIMRKGTINLIR
jgi:gliding motility-associated-like protein